MCTGPASRSPTAQVPWRIHEESLRVVETRRRSGQVGAMTASQRRDVVAAPNPWPSATPPSGTNERAPRDVRGWDEHERTSSWRRCSMRTFTYPGAVRPLFDELGL